MGITILLFFLFYMLDQITKYLVQVYAPKNLTVIPHILTLDLQYNTGMAFSFLDDKTYILVIVSLIASIALGYFCLKNDWRHAKLSSLSLTMAFSGCVGNLFDRAVTCIPALKEGRYGVVDMISFEPLNAISRLITGDSFAIFNLADAFLVVGVILYCIDFVFLADKRKKKYAKDNY